MGKNILRFVQDKLKRIHRINEYYVNCIRCTLHTVRFRILWSHFENGITFCRMENPNYYTCNRSTNCSTRMRQYVMYRHLSATKWNSIALSVLCALFSRWMKLLNAWLSDTPCETYMVSTSESYIFQMKWNETYARCSVLNLNFETNKKSCHSFWIVLLSLKAFESSRFMLKWL